MLGTLRLIRSAIDVKKIRNIGISAHIDSGKTTFSERVLFYAGKIFSIHQVKGSDKVGATMDFMELQKEKGITIQSAATHLKWNTHHINLIDTPGHVDFTIQVQRSLKVLDGAVLIICGSSGCQPQTLTVNRQMDRYNVPRIIFINKLDRMGSNATNALNSVKSKLNLPCQQVQIAIGSDDNFRGVVDLIKMKAYFFQGKNGQNIVQKQIPQKSMAQAKKMRGTLIQALSNLDKQMQQLFINQVQPTQSQIEGSIRKLCIDRKFYPVFLGSAYKNKGVQLALDGVIRFLPDPTQKTNYGFKIQAEKQNQQKIQLQTNPNKPFIGYAFKLEQSRFGQLTYIRVYQGSLKKGEYIYNQKKKVKVSRMVKMHASQMQQINQVQAGDIFALFGIQCSTGDTLTESSIKYPIKCSSLFVPQPVMSLKVKPTKSQFTHKFNKAIQKFQKQDPTFVVHVDKQSQQIIISGMGELHLDIYIQRMKRQYGITLKTGAPGVNYRETIGRKIYFDYLHKKQSGGAGQFARVVGYMEPINNPQGKYSNEFLNKTIGTNIPPEYVSAVQKAFKQCVKKGPLTGYPVVNLRYVLEDGETHVVDSSANAFALATKYSFLQSLKKAQPIILQPIMSVEVNVAQSQYKGVMAGLNKRKAAISTTENIGQMVMMISDVPLREMFGYATQLRGLTSGQGEFTMQYKKHESMNQIDANEAMQRYKIKLKQQQK